ncbi:MAG: heavy-metal-associated domain-containing protein [Rothia sp. (in: high G+C Gram-positive bacteria)]|uniref:heavy-metal-associated domain-containing protein n=1 Tax=Rothia sp. (in: high G+C Gram-positive bacteria) TaxID=1885016 RepID=UPI00270A8472|nr:heavy-metal-associated domain-containing protein [Rothia sp. (in: high G+C Gram-positive bacteria)]
MSATIVKATGLTCNHCAMSVREEIEEIENVTGVEVDVVKDGESTVTINHTGDLDATAVSAAIEEAGFTPVG